MSAELVDHFTGVEAFQLAQVKAYEALAALLVAEHGPEVQGAAHRETLGWLQSRAREARSMATWATESLAKAKAELEAGQ